MYSHKESKSQINMADTVMSGSDEGYGLKESNSFIKGIIDLALKCFQT